MQRKIIKISAYICLGMFLFFVIRADPRELLRIIGRLSPLGILCLLLLRVVFWIVRTLSWRIVLRQCSTSRIPFFTMLWAELAGHAVGHFTPSAKLGGDVMRAMMLGPIPKNQALASVVLDKSIELMATVLMMSLGLFIALVRIRMSSIQRILFLSLTSAAVILIYFFFRRQKKGLFIWIMETLKKLRIKSKYLEAKRERLIETDTIITAFYARHRRSFLSAFMLYILMILLWAVEIHLTFLFIGMHEITPMKSFLITTLGIVANIVPVIPAGIGIYEMTYMSVFAIVRIPQKSGIAVILVRRLLNLLLAVSGLFPMLQMKSLQAVKGEAAAVQISNPSAGNN